MRNCESKIAYITSNVNLLIIDSGEEWTKELSCVLKTEGYNLYIISPDDDIEQALKAVRVDYLLLDMTVNKELHNISVRKILFFNAHDDVESELLKDDSIIDVINKDVDFEYKLNRLPKLIEQFEKNSNRTVLITADDTKVLTELKHTLLKHNFNVRTTQSFEEVIEIIKKESISMLVLDLELHSQTYELFLQLRHYLIEELNLSLILSTSQDISSQFVKETLRSGVVDIFRKPYLIDELVVKIELSIANDENEHELACSSQLLEQYKNTVDRSSIVSKTDPKGVITYVNEAFCRISGYSEKELLGRPHNIVRHPDMDPAVFKDMWYTIKELKQPWKGKVRNKKKDGSDYLVQTIINPILNANGDVVEYIGIRTDITDVERTKEYFQKQYNITRGNFNEIMNLSKLYEEAFEQSSIILRLDVEHRVTYANEKFYEVSGLTKKELIGKHYDVIKRPKDVKKEYVDKMWKRVESGKVWKGQIRNISKNGKVYHSIATVVPIKNAKGEILEYMSIRKDITDVIELHEELEATQREIVYKMGEIGETRSKETGNHVKRVAEYSQLLAKLVGLNEKECDILFTASPMHDIGKVGIPDAILHKPGKLDDKEWKIMKTHSTIGYNILKNSKREVLQAAAIVAREHHEKWDGSGYPRKLKGEDIHIYGRITALADVFDALGSDRCYKKAWPDEKIFNLIIEEKGKHFDPQLVDLFMENLDDFKFIRNKYQDKLEIHE